MDKRELEKLKKEALEAKSEEEILEKLCKVLCEKKQITGAVLLYKEDRGKRNLLKYHCKGNCHEDPKNLEQIASLMEEALNKKCTLKSTLNGNHKLYVFIHPLCLKNQRCFGTLCLVTESPQEPEDATKIAQLISEIFSLISLRKKIISNPAIVTEILNLVDEAIWVVDKDGIILDANPAAEAMFGIPLTEFIGHYCHEVACQNPLFPNVCSLSMKASTRGKASTIETKSGLIYSVNVYRLDSDVEGTIYVFIAREISRYVKYHMYLIQADRARNLERITSGLAHEINNPLTAIIGFSSILMETETDPKKKAFLERIHKEALKCESIIKGLFALVPSSYPDYTLVDINQLIVNLAELKLSFYKTHNIDLELALDHNIPSVYTVPSSIYEAVNNILSNAEDAVMELPQNRKITVRTMEKGKWIAIEIENNGPQIPPHVMEKIFDPFFTTKPKGQGTGIGLSLAKDAVKYIGGRIEVENLEPTGVKFTIYIPKNTSAQITAPRDISLLGEKILVVSSDPLVSEMLKLLLERKGAQTVTVESLDKALEIHKEQGPFSKIIVNELTEDLVNFLENTPYFKERTILLASVPPKVETRMELKELGCHILLKPFTEKDLLRELAEEDETDSMP